MIAVLVYLLTALAVVDIVLTRRRLTGTHAADGEVVGGRLVDVHTGVGAGAVLIWVVFLLGPEGSLPGNALVGILGLALWWVTTLAGLLILSRWLPSRGRHDSAGGAHPGAGGPALAVLAHVGMLAGVLFFTWAYATSAV